MSTTMRIAIAATVLAACGDDELVAAIAAPDAVAPLDTDGGGCNAPSQTGCPVMQKCTWLDDRVDCVPDGTVPVGGACTTGEGGDGCSFSVCHEGLCRAFCTLSPDSCDAPERCVVHDEALADLRSYGVCVP